MSRACAQYSSICAQMSILCALDTEWGERCSQRGNWWLYDKANKAFGRDTTALQERGIK